jgi:hypothetical protein
MIACISLLRKRSEIDQVDFLQHWLGPHVAIARQLSGLRGLVAFSRQDAQAAICDGIGIAWFDDIAQADAAFTYGPVCELLREDRPKFVTDVQSFLAQEHIVVPPHRLTKSR